MLKQIALLCAAIALIYGNALFNDFAQDDFFHIVHNTQVFEQPWRQLFEVIRNSNHYRPVTYVSFSLSYLAHGMSPFGFHLLNIVLHGAVTIVLYLLFRDLLGASIIPLVAAWIFAVHPIHTEAVTSAVGRAELLA